MYSCFRLHRQILLYFIVNFKQKNNDYDLFMIISKNREKPAINSPIE